MNLLAFFSGKANQTSSFVKVDIFEDRIIAIFWRNGEKAFDYPIIQKNIFKIVDLTCIEWRDCFNAYKLRFVTKDIAEEFKKKIYETR
jgi:hypothetical protein